MSAISNTTSLAEGLNVHLVVDGGAGFAKGLTETLLVILVVVPGPIQGALAHHPTPESRASRPCSRLGQGVATGTVGDGAGEGRPAAESAATSPDVASGAKASWPFPSLGPASARPTAVVRPGPVPGHDPGALPFSVTEENPCSR